MNERERYLIKIKNVMFGHYNSTEIKDTLKELDAHFASASNSGITAEEVISEYGKPETVINELLEKTSTVVKQTKKETVIKDGLITAYILGMCVVFALSFVPIFSVKEMALTILAIASPALIWFLSGNNYLMDIVSKTTEKRYDFIKSQTVVFIFALMLNLCSFFIVPYMLIKRYIDGPKLLYIIYFIIASLVFMTALYLRKMFQGNLYMFFVVMQNISIILGMFLYISFLCNVESLDNIQFVFTQYFLCLFALIPYWLYFKKTN